MSTVPFKVFRGDTGQGALTDYTVEVDEGMVVLDGIHQIQARHAPDLAVRWNCKAGKCGSCSAEINGKPALTCMTRIDSLPPGPITVKPVKAFPHVRDLVGDVSHNFRMAQKIPAFTRDPATRDRPLYQEDVDRIQEFRKCIECFLCQNTCHVIRDHQKTADFAGPRFFARLAELEMHPWDTSDRIPQIKEQFGLGYCNITKCCTEVCPEHIKITDNAIIPLKERVVSRYYDPITMLVRKLFGSA